jgi:dTDP-4-dehydrorhamnose reductase
MTSESIANPSSPKYLIIGSNGQVGRALKDLVATKYPLDAVFLDRQDCDLENAGELAQIISKINPQVIINASAYTKVDLAEKEANLAFAINEGAVAVMARHIAQQDDGVLIHYSTDYVFDGEAKHPYLETDQVNPLSIYGQSKLAGEKVIQESFKSAYTSSKYFILRTSWVYGDGGNFIRTMLRLAAERDQLKVVADQIGVPTSAQWLAEVAIQMTKLNISSGIYHAVPDGEVSWHGLAMFAIETAATLGEGIEVRSENILPIPATEYPLPAPRPYNSRLNNAKLKKVLDLTPFAGQYPQWQNQVAEYVEKIVQESLKS